MKKYIVFILIMALTNSSRSQTFQILDTIILMTKNHSIYKRNVNWSTLEPKIHEAIDKENKDIIMAVKPAIGLMLDSLNDNHSFLLYGNERISRTTKIDMYSRINKETKKAIGWPNVTPIKIVKFNDKIAYISIPGMNISPEDAETKAAEMGQALRDSLCKLNPQNLRGIIVDLRLNTGGNMYPMIGGIAPLLGNGKAGSFVKDSKILSSWSIKNGNIYFGTNKILSLKNNCVPNSTIRIAVLIGPATGSSGEATAISFIGKNNVKLFGEKSTGLVSANAQFQLNANTFYYLASSYEADRKNHAYTSSIHPDIEIVGGDNFDDLLSDRKVNEALKWLNEARK